MEYKTIKIDFTKDAEIGDSIELLFGGYLAIKETFLAARTKSGEVQAADPIVTGETSARMLTAALQADFNSEGVFIVQFQGSTVTITSTDDTLGFALGDVSLPADIDSIGPITDFQITDVEISAGLTCDKFRMEITTSSQASEIISPVNNTVSTNPFTVTVTRPDPDNYNIPGPTNSAISSYVQVRNSGGLEDIQMETFPIKLTANAIRVDVTNTPGGSAVSVAMDKTGLEVEYRLGTGGSWQDSPTFTGLLPGSHTIYIRDQYGCEVSKTFSTDGIRPTTPHIYVSEALTNRYVKKTEFGTCSPYRNEKNTLSCQEDVKNPHRVIQTFQTCDRLITQIESNYRINRAVIKMDDGTNINSPFIQITNNLHRTSRMSAESTIVNEGQYLGIYFEAGDILNYDTGAVEDDYILNGLLPEWAVKGNYVAIITNSGDQWLQIRDIIYDDELEANLILVDPLGVEFLNGVEVKSLYNLEDYEVYEFTRDLAGYSGRGELKIISTDPVFGAVEYISERFEVRESWPTRSYIEYFDKFNTDIFYASGIRNFMRVEIEMNTGQFEDDSNSHTTDEDIILLYDRLVQVAEITFSPVTTGIMRKIVVALSHRYVYINGIRYVKQGEFEIERLDRDTNLYVVTANMMLADSTTTTKATAADAVNLNVPGLIKSGSGDFVKYKN